MAEVIKSSSARDALAAALRSSQFPAVAVAGVAPGGAIIVAEACGEVSGAPATVDTTIFLAASISKTILGVCAMQCVERGELSLDTDVNTYLHVKDPTLSIRNPAFPGIPITARHLLTHASGLRDDESALRKGHKCRVEGKDHTMSLINYVRRRLVPDGDLYSASLWDAAAAPGCVESVPPVPPPWMHAASSDDAPPSLATPLANYHYSNAGFTLLGLVVELSCGKSLPSLAQERIFKPLGMVNTSWSLKDALRQCSDEGRPVSSQGEVTDGVSVKASALPRLAVPHVLRTAADKTRPETMAEEDHGHVPVGHFGVSEWPASQVRTTATDLARFVAAVAASLDNAAGVALGARTAAAPSGAAAAASETDASATAAPRRDIILSPAGVREMLPSASLPEGSGNTRLCKGLGWWGHDATYHHRPGDEVWMHGGFMEGTRTHLYLWPRGLSSDGTACGMVILANGERNYEDLERALEAALREASVCG